MRVMLGGQAGSAGHLTIGDFAQVGAQAGMHRDVPASTVVSGYPAMEARLWRRVMGTFPRLPEVFRRLRRLERALGLGRGEGDEEPEPR
jgi:UDP-3-O-[3-hydroxymyristoyl] glucosamine N-acyltransferase